MNLFFVKERCATSLSIAGYLMNRGEKCVEVLEPSTWIIPSKDEASLCFAATNVLTILKNNDARRVFVQGSSRNINAIILASFLTELDVFVIDYTEATINPNLSLLGNIFKFNTSEETKLNFCIVDRLPRTPRKLLMKIRYSYRRITRPREIGSIAIIFSQLFLQLLTHIIIIHFPITLKKAHQ